jgi:hypothetical protein
VAEYWGTQKVPTPIGSANRMSAPYQAFRAADRHFVFGAANQKLWTALCGVLERPDLLADARFATNTDRMRNREALVAEIEPTLATRPADDWIAALLAAGVPAAPILTYAEALVSEQAQARNMVMEMEHPVEGTIRQLGFPVKMHGTPQQLRRPPPLLGQHTEEIMREAGCAEDVIEAPARAGRVRLKPRANPDFFSRCLQIYLACCRHASLLECRRASNHRQPHLHPRTKRQTMINRSHPPSCRLGATLALAPRVPAAALAQRPPIRSAGGNRGALRGRRRRRRDGARLRRAAVKHFPQPFIVVNKPGAAGVIGWTDVINAKPDGYKLALTTVEVTFLNYLGLAKFGWDELVPIAKLNGDPAVLVVRADRPYATLEQFLDASKKADANIRIGNAGQGSMWHLSAVALADKAGATLNHIPFAGGNPAIQALLGGHIEAVIASAPEVAANVQAGKLRALGVMSAKRQGLRAGADDEGAQLRPGAGHLARPGRAQGHAAGSDQRAQGGRQDHAGSRRCAK